MLSIIEFTGKRRTNQVQKKPKKKNAPRKDTAPENATPPTRRRQPPADSAAHNLRSTSRSRLSLLERPTLVIERRVRVQIPNSLDSKTSSRQTSSRPVSGLIFSSLSDRSQKTQCGLRFPKSVSSPLSPFSLLAPLRPLINFHSQAANIMSNELVAPDKFFLNRFGMNHGRARANPRQARLERKADYADLYFEYRSSEGLGTRRIDGQSHQQNPSATASACAYAPTIAPATHTQTRVTIDRMRLAAEAAPRDCRSARNRARRSPGRVSGRRHRRALRSPEHPAGRASRWRRAKLLNENRSRGASPRSGA